MSDCVSSQEPDDLPFIKALGTYLGKALSYPEAENRAGCDRLIVITDEQSHDNVPAPRGKGYVINVASSRNGVGYGPWTHVDG